MTYVHAMFLPDNAAEFARLAGDRKLGDMTCYGSRYPFGIFPAMELEEIRFSPITVFAGGNGSGKSTLLNVLAEKLHLRRGAPFNCTPYFPVYADLCQLSPENPTTPENSCILTSDDVFQYILRCRQRDAERDARRERLLDEYWTTRKKSETEPFRLTSLEETEELHRYNDALHHTPSRYVQKRLPSQTEWGSNGEHALRCFTESITENALILLDEPENSLSAEYQEKLALFLSQSVRFFGCQLVMATHSPILLAMRGARIYDLDARPARVRNWTELPNVQVLHRFFREHEKEWGPPTGAD